MTPWLRSVDAREGIFDDALSARRVHSRSIPRVGGVGFVVAIYVALSLALWSEPIRAAMMAEGPRLAGLALAGLLVAGLGFWDDLRGTSHARASISLPASARGVWS